MSHPPLATRFNVADAPEITPPFVLWTLPRSCALRELSDVSDPQITERLLRGARCVSDAKRLGNLHGDVVVQRGALGEQPLGFSVTHALEPLGGLEFVASQCRDCPANALQTMEPQALAGCVGFLVPGDDSAFHAFVQEQLVKDYPATTHSAWYRLWTQRELSRHALAIHRKLLEALAEHEQYRQLPGVLDYYAAVKLALDNELPLVVQAFPAGVCEGRRWHIPAHCGHCTAAWPEARRTHCDACGHLGGRQAPRTRRRMGIRPYRLLSEFLSETEIAVLLAVKSQ